VTGAAVCSTAMSEFGTFETSRQALNSLLVGEDRKLPTGDQDGAFDPERTSDQASSKCFKITFRSCGRPGTGPFPSAVREVVPLEFWKLVPFGMIASESRRPDRQAEVESRNLFRITA
jgi:hypothetical protein